MCGNTITSSKSMMGNFGEGEQRLFIIVNRQKIYYNYFEYGGFA